MKYKLDISCFGYIYILIPIVTSLIVFNLINIEKSNIKFSLIIFLIYSLIMFVFIKLSCLVEKSEGIQIKIFGVPSESIPFSNIECVTVSEKEFGLTALSKKKIKIVPYNKNGKGYLFSIKNMDSFIQMIKSKNIDVIYNNHTEKDINFKTNKDRAKKIILLLILFANILTIYLWDYLYDILNIFLPIGIVITNIFFAVLLANIIKNKNI